MKCDHLYAEFKKYEGQPVKIFTDDEKSYCGIDLAAYEDAVRILDKCSRTILVEYSHITAVVEPMMELRRCCRDHCGCGNGNGNDDYGNGDYGNGDDDDNGYRNC